MLTIALVLITFGIGIGGLAGIFGMLNVKKAFQHDFDAMESTIGNHFNLAILGSIGGLIFLAGCILGIVHFLL